MMINKIFAITALIVIYQQSAVTTITIIATKCAIKEHI